MGLRRSTLLPLGLVWLLTTTACTQRPDTPTPPKAGGTETPSTPTSPGAVTNPTEAPEPEVALSNDGIYFVNPDTGSTTKFLFGTDIAEAQAAATRHYGPPATTARNDECPGGPLTIITWPNGLALNAADSTFVGWSVRPNTESATLTTMAGIGIGSTRQDLEAAYTVEVLDSTLGVEFYVGPLAGLLTSMAPDAVITDLWSGEVCIFR